MPVLQLAPLESASSPLECEVSALFRAHRNSLLRYLLSFGLAPADAEEVVQDVFLNLYRHLREGKRGENLRGWLFRVGHNLALKQRQRDKRHGGVGVPDDLPDSRPGPEAQAAFGQRQARLRAVLHALPARDQYCLHLRAEGLRYREIGGVLGMSLGAVALSLSRSLARLAQVDAR